VVILGKAIHQLPWTSLEGVTDFQGRKVLQPDRTECEECDHEAVAHAPGAGEILVSECLCLSYQGQTSLHEPPGEDQPIEGAITLTEKRKFQNLERSFATLAENEEWLSTNHDKTVHRTAGPAKSASSLLPKRR
jgi:hypothetical protein